MTSSWTLRKKISGLIAVQEWTCFWGGIKKLINFYKRKLKLSQISQSSKRWGLLEGSLLKIGKIFQSGMRESYLNSKFPSWSSLGVTPWGPLAESLIVGFVKLTSVRSLWGSPIPVGGCYITLIRFSSVDEKTLIFLGQSLSQGCCKHCAALSLLLGSLTSKHDMKSLASSEALQSSAWSRE